MLPEPPYDGRDLGPLDGSGEGGDRPQGQGLFMPLRKAVTGLERGPEMADVMPLLQKKPTL
jgi:glutamyl-tRNA synthetase